MQDVYNIRKDNAWFMLRMRVEPDGGLYFDGQDFCTLSEQMFGDEEHEYYFDFTAQNAERLRLALGAETAAEGVLAFFAGQDRLNEFFRFCAAHDIPYHYFSF